MAIYHLSMKVGSRTGGQSAAAKVAYITRDGKYARGHEPALHVESGHMPDWSAPASLAYWDASDLYERANGRLFREIEFALPRELALTSQRSLAHDFAHHLTDVERLPFTLALHNDEGENPHCHLVISERGNDGLARSAELWFKRAKPSDPSLGGARKVERLKSKEWLVQTRSDWADFANRALERAGERERIDHRSLSAQGVERVPQIHLGAKVLEMTYSGLQTDRMDRALVIASENRWLESSSVELAGERELGETLSSALRVSRAEHSRESEQSRASAPLDVIPEVSSSRGVWGRAHSLWFGSREAKALERAQERSRARERHESESRQRVRSAFDRASVAIRDFWQRQESRRVALEAGRVVRGAVSKALEWYRERHPERSLDRDRERDVVQEGRRERSRDRSVSPAVQRYHERRARRSPESERARSATASASSSGPVSEAVQRYRDRRAPARDRDEGWER